ncbi:MAG: hypothetical protein A2915_03340 [Candidatus Yanofskybacteria bacterium RIFCSPLOWO2_01_FULL_41_34]|uniref:Spore protein YkvP/CgeB glycosyl transferase-like domain-containing protein n=1 Tax=Candidatus Yanofskybacteria bacterium RIFCSPHIGHO2_01_FULL_41_26 TaxID=1802661 RepID=A0A1F8EDS6_9BACT|nr:MAG: hypothetical protein A2649_01235 [Candidatus Yanofskybacteria bacterium RIFCSPHIGHO2_01_FULL_41_26]OGN21065.1 MAG: hypothetical protein A2915_03340 [Candidatus Yanofskybacteria bacterium RIFCSPLOWO2_01_FULL_41_34]
MKLIIVAPHSDYNDQIKRAFIACGVDIFYIEERMAHFLPKFLGKISVLWNIARKTPHLRQFNKKLLENKLILACVNFKPQAVLFIKATSVRPNTLNKIKEMGIKTANWFPENIYRPPYDKWFLSRYAYYDFFLTFDSSITERRTLEFPNKIKYVPFGADPVELGADIIEKDKEKFQCDICFIGAAYPERAEALLALKNYDIKIFGWSGWEKTQLADRYFGPLNAAESVKAYKRAKICLNMNTRPATNGVNVKTFEIVAAGGFQISDWRKDVEDLFIPGKEIVIFRDLNDLQSKVDYYLKHENERQVIAKAGHERLLKDHTLKQRAMKIIHLFK